MLFLFGDLQGCVSASLKCGSGSEFLLQCGSGSGSCFSSKLCEFAATGLQTLHDFIYKPPRLNRDLYSRTLEFWRWPASQNADPSGSGSATLPFRYRYRFSIFETLRSFSGFRRLSNIFMCETHTGHSLMHRLPWGSYVMMFSFVTDNCTGTFLAQMYFFAWLYCSVTVPHFQILFLFFTICLDNVVRMCGLC